MSTEAELIRQQMAEVRREMDEDVEDLVASARSLVDWRGYITSNPIITLGAAAAIGFVLIPKKKSAGISDLSGMLDGKRVVLAKSQDIKPKKSLLLTVAGALAATAMRSATAKIGQHFAENFSNNVQRPMSQPRQEAFPDFDRE